MQTSIDLITRFLWVDYQFRELCKLDYEPDVADRLGKLPVDLTAVYHDIMNSIFSQAGSSPQLATRALKWMLVANRPLSPQELVAAAELDPATLLQNTSANTKRRQLDIDQVIQLCGGFILQDMKLGVMRFTHLSVREYLETKNEMWSILDSHLLVAEACLWTLQDQHTLDTFPMRDWHKEIHLYQYAAMEWFEHCRLYQDLKIAASSPTEFDTEPNIPLLNSFLGSFNQASANYGDWVTWLGNGEHGWIYDIRRIYRVVYSEDLRPAFGAALGGLGQLVSWFWQSGANMELQNKEGTLLLNIAAEYGTPYIIERILTDERVNINARSAHAITALGSAVYGNKMDIVTFLLERGANINIISGKYGTALGCAAYTGQLDVVRLLLDRGADFNINHGHYGSALGCAAFMGQREVAKLLLHRGADINLIGHTYGTALGCAAFRGERQIATLLLNRGADVNVPIGGQYEIILVIALVRQHLDIAKLLIQKGAEVKLVAGDEGLALSADGKWNKLEIANLRDLVVNNLGRDERTA